GCPPTNPPPQGGRRRRATSGRQPTRQSPLLGSRRNVGNARRVSASIALAVRTRSSSALIFRISFTVQWTTAPTPSTPSASLTSGGEKKGGRNRSPSPPPKHSSVKTSSPK